MASMQLNPYSNVRNLPQANIAGLLQGVGQSQQSMGQNLMDAVTGLRDIGKADENVMYDTRMKALQSSPEFINASPMQKQQMIQQAGTGLELDPQNLRGQEQLFKQLGQEQQDLSAMERLGIQTKAQQDISRAGLTAKEKEAEKQRKWESEENLKKLKSAEKIAGMKSGAPTETTLSKIGAKAITPETIDKAITKTQEYISDNEDAFFDRELDKTSKNLLDQALTQFTSTPKGQEMIARGARPQEIWNEVSKTFKTQDKFEWKNLLPFGDSPFLKQLVPK